MRSLIIKSALITLSAILAATLVVFSLWILISPQSMATLSEKTGNYSFAVTCASLRYKYTNDSLDLSRCAEDSIFAQNNKDIIKYCSKLINDKNYSAVCTKKDEQIGVSLGGQYIAIADLKANYNSYILGHLAAAYYQTGDTTSAISTAQKDTSGQSYIKLVRLIVEKNDATAKEILLKKLNSVESNQLIVSLIKLLNQTKGE